MHVQENVLITEADLNTKRSLAKLLQSETLSKTQLVVVISWSFTNNKAGEVDLI